MRWSAMCVLLGLLGCGTEDDASARVVCEHFHNVATDASEGILSDDELRDKLKDIDETAQSADDDAVRTSARKMLGTFTQGTTADFNASVSEMSDACDPYRD